jgi:hypothetical protein
MDTLSAMVALGLVAAPLALLARWFVDRGYRGLGTLVNQGDSAAWWRATMPWPQGVQEEDGVAWHIRDPDPVAVGSPTGTPATAELKRDAFNIAPVRPQTRIRFHPPLSEREEPRR